MGFPVGEGRKGKFGTGTCGEGTGEVAEFDWELGGSGVEGSDGGVGLLLEDLRMLENHFWTAEAGDESEGVGVVVVVVVLRLSKEVLRVCFAFADFERISPLKLSTALFLVQQQSSRFSLWGSIITVLFFIKGKIMLTNSRLIFQN